MTISTMKFISFLLVLFSQFSFNESIAQAPTPTLDVKQSKCLVFLDSETNPKASVKFNSLFQNNGSKRAVTTWIFSGNEGKDWE